MSEISKSIRDFIEKLKEISKLTKTEREVDPLIDELEICRKKAKKVDNESNAEEPQWNHVIFEIMLTVLLQNSKQYRNLVKSFFPNLCPFVDKSNIKTLLFPLALKDNPDLTFTNDDEDHDGDDDDNSDDDDDDEEEEEEDDENLTVNDQLKMAVQKVLLECSGAGNDDQDSVNLSDMDETEGDRLNELLSETFRNFKKKSHKKEANVKNQQKVEFKVKIFDLLDIYVKSVKAKPEILLEIEFCILNLFEETCQFKNKFTEPLRSRCEKILKFFEKKCRVKFEPKMIRKHIKKLLLNYDRIKSAAGAIIWSDFLVFWANYVNRSDDTKAKNIVDKLIDENFANFKKKNQLILLKRLAKTDLNIKFQLIRKLNFSHSKSLKLLTLLYMRLNKTIIANLQIELTEIERMLCKLIETDRSKLEVNRTSIDLFEMLWRKRQNSLAIDWKLVSNWLRRNDALKNSSIAKKLAKKLHNF